jgi:cell division protein FtsB
VLGYVGWGLLFADYGYKVYRREAAQLEQLKSEIEMQKKKREELAREVLRLRNDPDALEELIHRELGYVHADEFMLVMPAEEQSAVRGQGAGVKRGEIGVRGGE